MKTIYVYENWLSEEPSLIGKLYVDAVRGGEKRCLMQDSSRTQYCYRSTRMEVHCGKRLLYWNVCLDGI